jgi:hypothetical protein
MVWNNLGFEKVMLGTGMHGMTVKYGRNDRKWWRMRT